MNGLGGFMRQVGVVFLGWVWALGKPQTEDRSPLSDPPKHCLGESVSAPNSQGPETRPWRWEPMTMSQGTPAEPQQPRSQRRGKRRKRRKRGLAPQSTARPAQSSQPPPWSRCEGAELIGDAKETTWLWHSVV